MNRLFIVIAFIPFIFMACQPDNQSDTTQLHQRITKLEQRAGSLEKRPWDIQMLKVETPVQKMKTRPVKKAKEFVNTSTPTLQALPVRSATTNNYTTNSSLYSSSQCMDTTQKGNCCKRTVCDGGYCWQYEG